MKCPLLLRVAYLVGLNPYSQICSRKLFYIFGITNILYILLWGIYVLIVSFNAGYNSVSLLSAALRTLVTCYFVLCGLQDFDATVDFYKKILCDIDESPTKTPYAAFDTLALILFLTFFLEISMFDDNIGKTILILIGGCLNTFVDLATMMMFSLCCISIETSYSRLQEDILQTFPRTASITICRLRIRHVDIVDRVRDISNVFGLRLLLYIVMTQIILLEKVDYIIYRITYNGFSFKYVFFMYLFCAYIVSTWYFSYRTWRAAQKHAEALATLLDLDTMDLDDIALEQIALLAEELHLRPTVFSASDCFIVGFPIFFSMIGIVFSYAMIVGPLAYSRIKSHQTI